MITRTTLTAGGWARILILVTVSVLAQITVLDRADFGGLLRVDLPLLVVVALGLVVRPEDAAAIGFAAGLGTDFFQVGPFGQYALAITMTGYVVAVATTHTAEVGPFVRSLGRRSFIAGTATVGSWIVLVIVGTATASSLHWPTGLPRRLPLGTITGSVFAIHLVIGLVGALGVVNPRRQIADRRLGASPPLGSGHGFTAARSGPIFDGRAHRGPRP